MSEGAAERFVVGLDLGGTNLRGALADGSGEIIEESREWTVQATSDVMIDQMAALVVKLAGGRAIEAVGVSAPVSVDPNTGRVDSTANVPGLAGVHLAEELERAVGVPVVVENDANLAALAEGRSGVAVGVRDYVLIAIGTGIGMGIVIDGELRRGWRGMGGEIGFLPMPEGSNHPEGSNYEAVVAGPAVRLRIAEAVASSAGTRLSADSSLALFSHEVAAGALADPLAIQILDEEARLIAWGVAAVAAILDPELVVLGGGIGAIPGLLDPVRAAAKRLMAQPPRIETSALGERGPLLGAVEAARSVAASRIIGPAGRR